MIVAGGIYLEYCVVPPWDEYYGSAGRAVEALGRGGATVSVYGYADEDARAQIEARGVEHNYGSRLSPTAKTPSFSYWTPLHRPTIEWDGNRLGSIRVQDDLVLRFGMLEADVIVEAGRAVYDPQAGSSTPEAFEQNGSRAEHLAIVANESEILGLAGMTEIDKAAKALIDRGAEVVFVKCGVFGVQIYCASGSAFVGPYKTRHAFTIGSGDVFSAAIALFWGRNLLAPAAAADLASRAVAHYIDTRSLTLDLDELSRLTYAPVAEPTRGRTVYLAAPFFDLGQRHLMEDAKEHLRHIGMTVHSPLDLVGTGADDVVAKGDIYWLERSNCVLALVDGADVGTVFEVGWARSRGLPVVVYAARTREKDLTMLRGTGCDVFDDYVAAICATAWA